MKLKFGDILIIIFLIIMAIFLLPKKNTGNKVIIEANGKIVKQLDLSENTEYTYLGNYNNTIKIENNKVYISNASCPNKVCENSNKISKQGQVLCCLPNKLLVYITSSTNETDVISG